MVLYIIDESLEKLRWHRYQKVIVIKKYNQYGTISLMLWHRYEHVVLMMQFVWDLHAMSSEFLKCLFGWLLKEIIARKKTHVAESFSIKICYSMALSLLPYFFKDTRSFHIPFQICMVTLSRIALVTEKNFWLPLYGKFHCVKGIRIRSYSGPYFPAFGLNNSEYGPVLRSVSFILFCQTSLMS